LTGLGRTFSSENSSEARGLRLLRTWLSPEQRAQFDATRYFEVTGCDSGKRYRIHHGVVTNVHEMDAAGRPKVGWCFAPVGHLVAGDVMLAQKIALETKRIGRIGGGECIPTKGDTVQHKLARLMISTD